MNQINGLFQSGHDQEISDLEKIRGTSSSPPLYKGMAEIFTHTSYTYETVLWVGFRSSGYLTSIQKDTTIKLEGR